MEWFYLTVLSIAIILLIIMLTFIGSRIVNNDKSSTTDIYPPVQNTCPDLWQAEQVADIIQCTIPTNGTNIGNLKGSKRITDLAAGEIIGLNTNKDAINFASYETECDKKRWADKYNIKWDGVSNYNQC